MSCNSTGIDEEQLCHIGSIAASVPIKDFTIHGGAVHRPPASFQNGSAVQFHIAVMFQV